MKYLCMLAAAFAFLSTTFTMAAWPRLGESGQFQPAEAGRLPTELAADKNAAWVVDLPGPGASTPLVAGERIFVTCEIDGQNGLVCLGRDGAELWRQATGEAIEGKHQSATGANPSPTADDQYVVAYFKDTTLACYTLEGKPVWQTNLAERYGEGILWWDLATSPVMTSSGVLVAVMHEGDCYLVTFDLPTGEVVWRQERNYECAVESDQSYTTPAVVDVDGVETIVTLGSDYLTGHNAATGELLWEYGSMNPDNEKSWRNIASAAIDAKRGVAVVPYGRSEFISGIRLGGSGDITPTNEMWTVEGLGSDVPTPQIVGDRVFVVDDRYTNQGTVSCLDLMTGEKLWTEKLPRGRGKLFSSPLIVGEHLYCLRETGDAYVFKVSDGLELLSKQDLGEQAVATPVVIDSDVLIRTRERLYRFTGP